MRQTAKQRLAWRVQDIIVGVGLAQPDNSLAGGRTLHIPQVVSVAENPVTLDIRILPGQIPADFVKAAPQIAYYLDVARVQVVELDPPLIQLILVPYTRRRGGPRRSPCRHR